MCVQVSKTLECRMNNTQSLTSIEQIVSRYGSMTNYIKSQLITNPIFVALSPDEDNYEDKLSFLQLNGDEEYIRKYGSVDDKVYHQYGLDKPKFELA
jgi:hypothetical protein